VAEYVAAQAFLDKEHERPERLSPMTITIIHWAKLQAITSPLQSCLMGNTVHPLLPALQEICCTVFRM
jgi:hypothetical protein